MNKSTKIYHQQEEQAKFDEMPITKKLEQLLEYLEDTLD